MSHVGLVSTSQILEMFPDVQSLFTGLVTSAFGMREVTLIVVCSCWNVIQRRSRYGGEKTEKRIRVENRASESRDFPSSSVQCC